MTKTKRKILIGTPIKLGLTSTYITGFIEVMRAQLPDVTIEFCILEGPSVNLQRNEIAHYAKGIKAQDLVFIDADLKWTKEHFARLISHDQLDVVGALYCKKVIGPPQWTLNALPGGISEGDLCEVADIATGFMKIKVDTVFPAIDKKFPDLQFRCYKEFKDVTGTGLAMEYFPMGVTGPRHPRNRLLRVKEVMDTLFKPDDPVTEDFRNRRMREVIGQIDDAITCELEPGMIRGEDFYFCHLAREAGCKVWADFGMPIIPHVGNVAYPITPEMVGVDESIQTKEAPGYQHR